MKLVVLALLLATGRPQIINEALSAIRAAGPDGVVALDDQIGAGSRDRCGATPTAPCLVEVARAVCGDRASCARIADVLIANRLAETDRVSANKRYELMGSVDGYRVALRRELRAHYARLAAELAVAPELSADLGASIDQFCERRSRVTALAWQRCVAALVYYVGTSK